MSPIENQLPGPPIPQGGGTIPLSTLIDYSLQRTHHELTVLSELLPRKTDMERKIEIFQFASRTRQLFVRLLALVKWASSASKVDTCADICNFLEQQSMFFVDTADSLAKMARDTLVSARLPSFSLPCAIDVLTTGTYPRLPTCIRDKIIPADPITIQEKKQTLRRLNQVIQYRLVSSDLPPQMRGLKIDNGRVKFRVEHEFEVTLTLMGDSPTIPWRLLDIDMLVEDHETGDGKSLVHSLQIHYIHQLIQSRLLLDSDKPLHDLYKVLHSFCQSLQLEVLHSQTQRLIGSRLGDSIRVEEYTLSKSLLISYWRDQSQKKQDSVVYKLSVHVCEDDDGQPLQISHFPAMSPDESRRVGSAIKSDHLSIEKLLMQTIEVRTLRKLRDLAKELKKFVEGNCEVRDMPVALHLPVLNPSMSSEILRISINIQRGAYLASIPAFDHPVVQEIEDCLNSDRRGLEKLLIKLRLQLYLQRCEKSIQMMSTTCVQSLPIINMAGHPLEKLGKTKLYVRVPRQNSFYIVVELIEAKQPELKYYLLEVTPCTAEGAEDDIADDVGIKSFLKAGKFIGIDIYAVTHSPFSKIYEDEPVTELDCLTRKRKLYMGQAEEPPAKKSKGSPYFVPELAYLLATTEEKIPFIHLSNELSNQGLTPQGIAVDGEGVCMALSILEFPACSGCPQEALDLLKEKLLSCKFRMVTKPQRAWILEFLFSQSPVPSKNFKENGPNQRVCLPLDLSMDNVQKTVTDLLDEWSAMAQLYWAVDKFSKVYNDIRLGMQNMVEVHSYNYRKLTLAYGPHKTSIVTIQWRGDSFVLTLGSCHQSLTGNPHVFMITHLQQELNKTGSVSNLVQILHETWAPMTSICKLPFSVRLGGGTHSKQPHLSFTVIPQSPTHIRISFRNTHCIDVHLLSGRAVAVRDGSYSLFDTSKAIEGCTPTPTLKAFLNMYIDEAATGGHARRRSTTEDDNPPSPVGIDSMDVFMMQQLNASSPASRPRQDTAAGGFRFHSPMTPPSNPHTPASPGASRMPAGVNPSPSAALMGTPSPIAQLTSGSPGNPQLHVPSPGAGFPTPSPQSMVIHMPSPAAPFISPNVVEGGGSPFPGSSLAMPSPGTRNWPGSPSMQGPSPASHHGTATSPGHPALHSPQTHHKDGEHSRAAVVSPPSRILPQRSWAASIPTRLSHDAFDRLLSPSPLPGVPFVPASPLERFLGCTFSRRHLNRVIQSEDALTSLNCNEPASSMFKVDSLQFKVSLNPSSLQTLHMKITVTPDGKDQWASEEIQILEKFFDRRVACPPYKVNALTAFGRLLSAPPRILKDCVQIMRLELMPERTLKWSVQWCLTVPESTYPFNYIAPAGTPAILVKNKMIIMLQLTRIGLNLPPGAEPQSIFLPLVYDVGFNTMNIVEPRTQTPTAIQITPTQAAITTMLKRFSEMHQNPSECAIFPGVRELMANLVLPVS